MVDPVDPAAQPVGVLEPVGKFQVTVLPTTVAPAGDDDTYVMPVGRGSDRLPLSKYRLPVLPVLQLAVMS